MRKIEAWLSRFCYNHPRIAIPHLVIYLIIGNSVVFLLDMFSQGTATALMMFHAASIFHGELWRLVTFVFVPNSSGFWIIFYLLFLYYIGTTLERTWGSAKFTVFYLLGVILTAVTGLVAGGASMQYINLSLLFAFASLYGETQVLLIVIPIKVKWLAWINAGFFAVDIIRYLLAGQVLLALLPVVAILNYLLFFYSDIRAFLGLKQKTAAHKRNHKTVDFQAAQKHVKEKKGYLHKCAVCGRTDQTNPELEFRYCSKCNGYYCYCSDHINSHVHIE